MNDSKEIYQGAYKGRTYDASVAQTAKIKEYLENELPEEIAEMKNETSKKASREEIRKTLNELDENIETVIFNCGNSEGMNDNINEKQFNIRLRSKKDTEENWLKNDPVLLDGEVAISVKSDGTEEIRIGNGTDKFSKLKPFSSGGGGGGSSADIEKETKARIAADTALDEKKVDKQTANGGFAGGGGASVITSGAAVGATAMSNDGGAIGANAFSYDGGAIGLNAKTLHGFAGGKDAKTTDLNDNPIDAIQLGTGTNPNPKTIQIYDKQLLDADGHIPNDRMPTKVDKIEGKSLSTNDYGNIDKQMSLRRNSMDWEKLHVLSRNFTIKGICYRAKDSKYYALSPTQHGVYYYSDDGINFTPRISPYFYREYHKNGYLPAEMYCMSGGFVIVSYKTDKTGWKLTYVSDIGYNSETTDSNDFIDVKTYTETFDKFSVYYDDGEETIAVAVDNKLYYSIVCANGRIENIQTSTFGTDATVWINSRRTIDGDTYTLTNKGILYKNGTQLINYAENATMKEKIGTSTTYEFFDFNTVTYYDDNGSSVTRSFVVMTANSYIPYNKYFCSPSIFYAEGNLNSTTWVTGVHNSNVCGMYTSHPVCELLNNEPELFIFSNEEYNYTYKIGSTDWIYHNKKGGMSVNTPKIQIISKSSAVKKVNGNWYFCDKFIDDMICIPSTVAYPTFELSEPVKLKHDITAIFNNITSLLSYQTFVDEEDATNWTGKYKKYSNNGISILTSDGMIYDACLLGHDNSLTDDQYSGVTDKSYNVLIDFENGRPICINATTDKIFSGNTKIIGAHARSTVSSTSPGFTFGTSDYAYKWYCREGKEKEIITKFPFKVNCEDRYRTSIVAWYGGEGGVFYSSTNNQTGVRVDTDNPNVKINDIYTFGGSGIGATKWAVGSNGYFGEMQNKEMVDQRICWWTDENYPITDDLYAVCCNDKYLIIGGDNGALYMLTNYNDTAIVKNICLDKSENIRYIVRDMMGKDVNKLQSSSELFIIVTEKGSIYTLDTGNDNPKAEFCSSIGNNVKRVEYMRITGRFIIVDADDNLYINDINQSFMPGEMVVEYTPNYNNDGTINFEEEGTFSDLDEYDGKAGLVPAPTAKMLRCKDAYEKRTYDTTATDKEKYYRWMFFGSDNNDNWESSYFLSADGKWIDLMPYKSAGTPKPSGISFKPFLCPASLLHYNKEGNRYDMHLRDQEKYFLAADGNWREVSTNVFTGATATADGAKGAVPAPTKGQQDLFLRADGTWSMAGLSEKMINRVNAIVYYDGQYDDNAASPLELVTSTQNVKCSDLTKTGTILIPFEINTTSITGIADNGFENSQCWYTYIPNTITTIGASAFKGCTNLMTIQLPDTITSIGESCFEGDTSLKKIYLSESMTSIPANAFKGCTALKSVFIPDTIDTIADTAFEGCLSTLKIYTVEGSAADTFATTKGFNCMYTVIKKS